MLTAFSERKHSMAEMEINPCSLKSFSSSREVSLEVSNCGKSERDVHFCEPFPSRLSSSAWLHSAHAAYGWEEKMDGFQLGDLAFNQPTNQKIPFPLPRKAMCMCMLGWPSMLFPSHQNLLPASDVKTSLLSCLLNFYVHLWVMVTSHMTSFSFSSVRFQEHLKS